MWDFFNNHWIVAVIILLFVCSLLENVLTIINNVVKVWGVKVQLDANKDKTDA